MFRKIKAMPPGELVKRLILYVCCFSLMPLGIVLTINAHLGAGGIDAMNFAMAEKLGVNTSIAVYITAVVCLLLSAVVRRGWPRITTFITSFLTGIFTDIWKSVLADVQGTDFWNSLLLFLLGLIIVGFAVGCVVTSEFPAGPVDDLMVALKERGCKIWISKIVIEGAGVAIAFLLGGEIGLGTIIFTFCLGPVVDASARLTKKAARL
ncbi:membrane protein [Anaerolentibacter hominis]|uniref:YczE/YyaS/YitT family protein n=1 Tax=Anaerolentibacter hominis TaxID=3079009 RepID=UPI0031B80C0C